MLKNNASSFNKKALLAEKEMILQELQYYEKRIQDFPNNSSSDYFNVNNSSDSEDDFPTTLEQCLSMSELKHQERLLNICLLATQELTGVGLLQSEINVMVEDPIFDGEKPVTEPGLWREVTAECRIDLVPFSISFFVHRPSRKFAQLSYRGLHVLPVKTAHEIELSKSVLTGLCHPSDAIEVLRSYSVAYRSRRTTMARLAGKYANSLFMEPLPGGGFILKCANLLEMSWRLDNKTSAVAPFHHKMNFDLEHIDESYLKIIKQAHRQLSNPSLKTDERTRLLARIISTCLEAQGPTQELYESMESDTESIRKHEKTTLTDDESTTRDKNDDGPEPKRKRDDEVMAPPKAIPKKAKPKGKENMNENRKTMKRTGGQVVSTSGKKAKTDGTDENVRNSVRDIENARNSKTDAVRQVVKETKNGVGDKNKVKTVAKQKNIEKVVEKEQNVEKDSGKTRKQSKNTKKVINKPNSSENIEKNKVTEKAADNNKNAGSSKNIDQTTKAGNFKNSKDKDIPTKKLTQNDKTGQVKSIEIDNNDKTEQNKPLKSADPKSVKKVKETNETKINEKTTASSKATTQTTENEDQMSENIEKVKNVNSKNAKNNKIKIIEENKSKAVKPISSANQETQINVNANNNINSDPANAKKNVKSHPANAKKDVKPTAKKSVNNPKDTIEKSSKASKVAPNEDLSEGNDINILSNPKSATENKEVLANDSDPMKTLSKNLASTKNTANDAKNLASTKNTANDAKNLASTKNTANDAKNLASTKNTANDAKNLASTKNTANDAKNLASTKNTANDAKNLASTKNTANDAKNLASTKNTANDANNLASTKNTANDAKNLASTKNTANDAKNLASTKNTTNDAKNLASTKNTANDAKNLASTKNTANDANNLASTKNTANDAKNLASTKNTANDAKNLASTKNTANDAKNLASTKNTANDAKNLASTKNTANDAKNLASTKNTANDAKNLASTKNTANDAKNLASTKNTANDAKTSSTGNQDITKNKSRPKMVVKNHRNSVNKLHKKSTIATTLKPNISKESGKISKIPQKKLSPAYAAVLKQNPVRISPRMMSKFKSPSDPNVQSKFIKPITNIPRLQKKPAPKSK